MGLHVRLGGYLRIHQFARKALDPLHARAMCIRHKDDPTQTIIMMAVDLVGFQYRMTKIVRRIISTPRVCRLRIS